MAFRRGAGGRMAGWILFFIILLANYFGSSQEPTPRRPAPRMEMPPETMPPISARKADPRRPSADPVGSGKLRDPNVRDGALAIEVSPRKSGSVSTGTAFSINDSGLWITARHVTDGCDRIVLRGQNFKNHPVRSLIQHPGSDVSIFTADLAAEPLLVNYETPSYGQKGYHFGFPQGKAGDVYSVLMGRKVMQLRGTRRSRENVLVWAERDSYPRNDKSLGGISGGPIVDGEGAVVGIHVAGSVRRGRNYSSLPQTIQYLANKGGYTHADLNDITAIQPYLNERDFAAAGGELRRQKTVAQVICLAK